MNMYGRAVSFVFFLSAGLLANAQGSTSSDNLQHESLQQAQRLLLDYFPTVYTNGLGFDADEWEQSIRIDEQKGAIEYKRRPWVPGNTKEEWYATFIVPLSAIVDIKEEHKTHTITIETNGNEISCYNFDLLAARSSSLQINMRDLDTVRSLAGRVLTRIQTFCKEQQQNK